MDIRVSVLSRVILEYRSDRTESELALSDHACTVCRRGHCSLQSLYPRVCDCDMICLKDDVEKGRRSGLI